MSRRPSIVAAILSVFLLVAVLASWAAMDGRGDGTPSPTPTVSSGGSGPSPSPAVTATPTGGDTPTSTVTATPTATRPPSAGEAPPPGYLQSCAAKHPWGQQVDEQFVCIEEPQPGASVRQPFEVRGYAGGAFESALGISIRVEQADGSSSTVTAPVQTGITYRPPDIGMPGAWAYRVDGITVPDGGTLRFTISIESPRDGSTVTSATREFRLQP